MCLKEIVLCTHMFVDHYSFSSQHNFEDHCVGFLCLIVANFEILSLAPKHYAIHPIFFRYVCGFPKTSTLRIEVAYCTKQQKVTK